jgi:hypothetical protein
VGRAPRRSSPVLIVPLLCAVASPCAAAWTRQDTERAILYFQDGALSAAEQARFARLVDDGIRDIETYLRPAAGARGLRDGRITYRIGDEMPYALTRGTTVFLPVSRVRTSAAPYLHETVHVLVRAPHRSVWLSEGFASYVDGYVVEHLGGYDARVFTRGGNRGVDAEARGWLARDLGRAVLPYVGVSGEPPGMAWDRRRVAAPFYVMSQSFTKFLVERLGLGPVLDAVSSHDPEAALARASGRTLEAWRTEWRASLGPERAREDAARVPPPGGP